VSRSKSTTPPPEPRVPSYRPVRRQRKQKVFKMSDELPDSALFPTRNRLELTPLGTGQWGSLFKFAFDNPGKWCQSHPMPKKRRALQWASDIRRRAKSEQQVLIQGDAKGHWEAEYGTAKDDINLMHWVVWVKWERRAPEAEQKKNRTKHRRRREDTSNE